MPFDTALSGIRAAASELEITGNNIANASTTGFKSSRAEFGDVYATSVLGSGTNQVGSGVQVQDTSQLFTQGNVTFTDNALDMAVNGNGFFILSDDGGLSYTRSGDFGLDSEGFVTANNGARLQGYTATTAGEIEPVTGDLRIQNDTLAPRQTTDVNQGFNLDATSDVLPSNGQSFQSLGPVIGVAQAGVGNGYPSQSFDITSSDGSTLTYTTNAGDSASELSGEINSIVGLTATASTTATLNNFNNVANPLTVTINSVPLNVSSLADLETQVNQLTNSSLPGITAAVDGVTGDLVLSSTVGSDISITIAGDAGATLDVAGSAGAAQALVSGGADTATVGGTLSVVVEDGFNVTNFTPDGTGLFEPAATIAFNDVVVNAFDPEDTGTYNAATSTTVYDSLGIPHVMTQYFVKQPFNPTDPTSSPNQWQMHVLIDGQDVGNADATVDPFAPTRATFDVFFNPNGSLDTDRTDTEAIFVSNWAPENALPPNPAGQPPFPDPPVSSNFSINIGSSTQFGTPFAVESVDQNGFTAGQLSGVNVDEGGVIFARYTNGESLALGQVVLADFANQQGLQPLGGTTWAQTFESGAPVVNQPQTGSLGAVQAGALEESNVDLSAQLVALIIAQRNFQASAKTIETADSTTQTIINLR